MNKFLTMKMSINSIQLT